MRWVTYGRPGAPASRVGVLHGGQVHGLREGSTLVGLLQSGPDAFAHAGRAAIERPDEVVDVGELRLLAPIPDPPSVRDFYAFEAHVRTARAARGLPMDPDWYEIPVFYFSNPAAVYGPDDDVPAAPGSVALDFELEVACVVGRAGSDLTVEEAAHCIAGYTVLNDWSARDLQRREMAHGLGPAKGKDFATSLGPWLVTADELAPRAAGPAFDLAMVARVNGREVSRASLADLSWSFAQMLAYASRGTRLRPGDVIGSGTCGTGCLLELSATHGGEAYPWLAPGDVVELEVEGLGVLRNRLVEPSAPVRPLR